MPDHFIRLVGQQELYTDQFAIPVLQLLNKFYRRTPSDDKNSHGFWPGELNIKWIRLKCSHTSLCQKKRDQWLCHYISGYKLSWKLPWLGHVFFTSSYSKISKKLIKMDIFFRINLHLPIFVFSHILGYIFDWPSLYEETSNQIPCLLNQENKTTSLSDVHEHKWK